MSNVKKNYLFTASYQLFALLVPIIVAPYIARVLGASGTGVYSYTYSMVRYFWLASALGTATLGVRSIGMYQNDLKKKSECFWNIVLLKAILSVIFGMLYFLYVVLVSDNKVIAIIQGINLVAVLFDITWLYQGMERFDKVALKNFIIKVLSIIYIFTIIKTSNDLWKYTLGVAFFQLVGNFILWFNIGNYVEKVKVSSLRPFKQFKNALLLFIPSVAAQIFSVFDKSMIGWITNNSLENGYYEQAIKIVDMSLMIITAFAAVMIPKMAREYRNNDKEKINESLDKSFRFVIALAVPMFFGILSISKSFVPLFFGEEYVKAVIILNILSLLFFFMGINSVSGTQYLISTNQQNTHTKFLIIGGLLNIILNVILISRYNAVGAAIGSVAGEVLITVLELSFLYRSGQYNFMRNAKTVWKYLLSGLIMYVALYCFSSYMTSLIYIFLFIIMGAIIYVLLLLLFREELITNEMKAIINKFKKR